MSNHTQFLRRPSGSRSGSSISNAFGLSEDAAAHARRRVQLFAMIFGATQVVTFLLPPLFMTLSSAPFDTAQIARVAGINAIGLLATTVMYFVAKSKKLSDVFVLFFALAYIVESVSWIRFNTVWAYWETFGHVPHITFGELLIVFFPMIVPWSTKMTRIMAFLTLLSAPMNMIMLAKLGVVPYDDVPAQAVMVSVAPFMAGLFAIIGTKIVHRLQHDATKAMRLGSYVLEDKLGEGGMGEVWRASHHMLARPAAVKLIRSDALGSRTPAEVDTTMERFRREAKVISSLTSTHSVALYDYGRAADGRIYYVMELLEWIDLQDLVDRFGAQPPERVAHILYEACDALAEAHANNLVHRDVKPGNLYLARLGLREDYVKILDFGLVRIQHADDSQSLTRENVVGGTPAFIAPEQAEGLAVDGRADIYALGVVAWWLLTGRLLFEKETAMKTIVAHVTEPPRRPSMLSEYEIPAEFEAIVMRCLEKDPKARYGSAGELARALERVQWSSPWTRERARKWWGRHHPERSTRASAVTETLEIAA